MKEPKFKSKQSQGAEDRKMQVKGTTSLGPSHDEIARRAYEIYLEDGCRDGHCQQNWNQAEREMRDELREPAPDTSNSAMKAVTETQVTKGLDRASGTSTRAATGNSKY